MHVPSASGEARDCGALAVVIWQSRDGLLPVCEQCEAMIIDTLDEANFSPCPVE